MPHDVLYISSKKKQGVAHFSNLCHSPSVSSFRLPLHPATDNSLSTYYHCHAAFHYSDDGLLLVFNNIPYISGKIIDAAVNHILSLIIPRPNSARTPEHEVNLRNPIMILIRRFTRIPVCIIKIFSENFIPRIMLHRFQ